MDPQDFHQAPATNMNRDDSKNGFLYPTSELLTSFDSTFDRYSYSSSPTSSSLPSNGLTVNTSRDTLCYARRDSIISGSVSIDGFGTSSLDFASPITPAPHSSECWSTPSLHSSQGLSEITFQTIEDMPHDCFMDGEEAWTNNQMSFPTLSACPKTPATSLTSLNSQTSDGLPPFIARSCSLALSRDIFGEEPDYHVGTHSTDMSDWTASAAWSTPQTIAPRATFQTVLPSSPVAKLEPSTPHKLFAETHPYFDSSPMTTMSPVTVPSQPHVDFITGLEDDPAVSNNTLDVQKAALRIRQSCQTRFERRPYGRKTGSSSQAKSRSTIAKSGMEYEAIIPQNTFVCGYGCIDKSTDKPKRFKRQEHRKRHERTVHERDGHFPCWVEGCKTRPFSRGDNLKTHLLRTHGKTSPAQRNRYVATLDKSSKFYDFDWKGPLTWDGYPLIENVAVIACGEKNCRKVCHTKEGVRAHMLKDHGKAGGKSSCASSVGSQWIGPTQEGIELPF